MWAILHTSNTCWGDSLQILENILLKNILGIWIYLFFCIIDILQTEYIFILSSFIRLLQMLQCLQNAGISCPELSQKEFSLRHHLHVSCQDNLMPHDLSAMTVLRCHFLSRWLFLLMNQYSSSLILPLEHWGKPPQSKHNFKWCLDYQGWAFLMF